MKCRFQVRDIGIKRGRYIIRRGGYQPPVFVLIYRAFFREDNILPYDALRYYPATRSVAVNLYVGEAISLPLALNITFVFGRMVSSPTVHCVIILPRGVLR